MKTNTQTNNVNSIDILNRGDFISRTIQLVESVTLHKGNITFAINGQWGCGKTFVLEKIENKLSETNKYLVVHYNCWQYDYYDEPLIAIVSLLQEFISSSTTIDDEIKTIFTNIAIKFGLKVTSVVSQKYIGFDIVKTCRSLKNIFSSQKSSKNIDKYYDLKEAINDIKKGLTKLAEKQTIVFAVDELDRCLPEYAIKVLERLHHITEGLSNIVTIIAVDKSKLEHTISSIFGKKDVAEYLKKFIRFEFPLDNGKTDGNMFLEKFAKFRNRFDKTLFPNLQKETQFIEEMFQGIDARSQEIIVDKATIINDIWFGDEKQDYTVMYMELFLANLYYHYHEKDIISNNKIIDDLECIFKYKNIPESFGKKGSGFYMGNREIMENVTKGIAFLLESNNIFMIIVYYWYELFAEKRRATEDKFWPTFEPEEFNSRVGQNLQSLKSKLGLLKTIE